MTIAYTTQRRVRPVAVWLALAVVALHAAAAETWMPACDETRNGRYTFEGLAGSNESSVEIDLCPDVRCTNKTEFATVKEDTYSAPMPQGLARPYFLVKRQGETRIIGARRLALVGAYNFRDLGGIQTLDGKTVRWGQAFRSDTLSRLTTADFNRLNAIGVSLVCDLRTRDERRTDPTEWQGAALFSYSHRSAKTIKAHRKTAP